MPKRSEATPDRPMTLFSMILRRGKKHKLAQAVEKRTYMNQYMKKYFRTVSDNVSKLNENNRAKKEGEKRKGISTDSKFSKEDLNLIDKFMKNFERKFDEAFESYLASKPAVRIH